MCNASGQCECQPQSCADLGAQCGVQDDGCGGTVDCGGCPMGMACRPDNTCTLVCTSDADCANEPGTPKCRLADSSCVACLASADCASGEACVGNVCVVPTGAVGDPCRFGGDCAPGSTCLTESSAGLREGYCSAGPCTSDAQCPTGSHCGLIDPSTGQGACLADCTADTDCRSEGYACYDADGDAKNECWVAGTGTGSPGDPCTGYWECAGGPSAQCESESSGAFRQGYCYTVGCTSDADCASGSHCGYIDANTNEGVCIADCTTNADCRADGYACYDADGDMKTECWPAGTGSSPVGGPCSALWECSGGPGARCIGDGTDFYQGYCTIVGCTANGGCPTGSHCGRIDQATGEGQCMADCTADTDCRPTGYLCYDYEGNGTNECWPAGTGNGAVGDPCSGIWDCSGGRDAICFREQSDGTWPGGYCSLRCDINSCPQGSMCYAASSAVRVCLDECGPNASCRPNYTCTDVSNPPDGTGDVCL